jgi:hypothetical protein
MCGVDGNLKATQISATTLALAASVGRARQIAGAAAGQTHVLGIEVRQIEQHGVYGSRNTSSDETSHITSRDPSLVDRERSNTNVCCCVSRLGVFNMLRERKRERELKRERKKREEREREEPTPNIGAVFSLDNALWDIL